MIGYFFFINYLFIQGPPPPPPPGLPINQGIIVLIASGVIYATQQIYKSKKGE